MLEYFSRTFDYSSAMQLTIAKSPRRRDLEYSCMVKSLISNVNSVYAFTSQEIEQIVTNIKHAGDRYIHYENKSSTKYLSYDELFRYSCFMQDLVLLNIYKIINLDIQNYEFITFEGFYYNKKDLL